MKILQITHFGTKTNYGAVLQAYALQQALKKMGHEPILLRTDFYFHNILKKWYRDPIRLIRTLWRQHGENLEEQRHPRRFADFVSQHLTCSEHTYQSLSQLQDDQLEADAMVTGSDQVWSGKKPFPPYFLQFGPSNAIRFSYAASVGNQARHHPKFLAAFKQATEGFSAISVREQEALEVCRQAGRTNAQLVLDPIFLLEPTDYERNLKLPPPEKRPVCLVYLVGKRPSLHTEAILNYCQKNNLQPRFIRSQHNGKDALLTQATKLFPTIPQWIQAIRDASLVVTDSFHGTAFSILFNKRLVTTDKARTDARFKTLDALFGIGPAFFNGDFNVCADFQPDYQKINATITSRRQEAMDFLMQALKPTN